MATESIKSLTAPEEQHMLLLFLPLKKKTEEKVNHLIASLNAEINGSFDPRPSTGVHFFMIYRLKDGERPSLPVTSFQTMPGKDLLVVLSIYDADFTPYIASFVRNPIIAALLDGIVQSMDETDIFDPTEQSSAEYIRTHGGVAAHPDLFNCLLMRYNFGDPTQPASRKPSADDKYLLNATFPGLTVGKILQTYPEAGTLWPFPPTEIEFEESQPPSEC